jgi:arylsulfatase A-like enzyme
MHWKSRNAPDEHVPGRRGWDFRISRGGNNEGQCDVVFTDSVSEEYKRYRDEMGNRFGVGGESREGYVGDVFPFPAAALPEAWLCDRAVDYLHNRHDAPGRREADQPFCLLVSMDKPHPANVIPQDYDGMYSPDDVPLPPRVPDGFREDDPHVRRQIETRGWGQMDERELRTSIARYLANVTYVDDSMGKVLHALDECGYADNTLVVVLSDHGELLGERGNAHTKYSLYDNAVRVPLIVRWPGMAAGLVSNAAVELIDLMPTWLDAAGLETPPYLPGRSLRPLLEGHDPAGAGWREATLSEQYTAAQEEPGSARGQWTIRELRWKLNHRAGARSALYDLEHDPGELHNLIDSPDHAAVRDRLRARIVQGAIERAEQYPARFEPQVVIARAANQPNAPTLAGRSA